MALATAAQPKTSSCAGAASWPLLKCDRVMPRRRAPRGSGRTVAACWRARERSSAVAGEAVLRGGFCGAKPEVAQDGSEILSHDDGGRL